MTHVSFETLVQKLKALGIPASASEHPYVKDVHGWPYDRVKYCLTITLPLYKQVVYCNVFEPRMESKTVAELAAFGLKLAQLGETDDHRQNV